ncbi:subclass B1 metallo-beta-lactamase [Kordiimonas aestuarii]|uniref:subclass B1 metallo-beta-lactamase n=1 Tax=Kordiimonas aestuarii TaxID=1005925 RepID=UPI0021D3ABB6|nr:subclass B1 metallo-beta-lactamase [Kordiimonas aestuarii]
MRTFFTALFLVFLFTSTQGRADDGDVVINRLADGVWRHVSFHDYNGNRVASNGLIVRDGDQLYLVDSAWGDENTETLLDLIDERFGLPVAAAVATHSHADRAAGADVFARRGIPFYASEATRALVPQWGLAVPAETLDIAHKAGAKTRLGPLEIMYPGVGHTADNLVVWLPALDLLFGGCVVRGGTSKDLGYFKEGDPLAWADAMELIIRQYGTAEIVVPGHGETGDAVLLSHTADLIEAHLTAQP